MLPNSESLAVRTQPTLRSRHQVNWLEMRAWEQLSRRKFGAQKSRWMARQEEAGQKGRRLKQLWDYMKATDLLLQLSGSSPCLLSSIVYAGLKNKNKVSWF